jgi:16S rRNA (cytosine1402-N4)-methyltransferase
MDGSFLSPGRTGGGTDGVSMHRPVLLRECIDGLGVAAKPAGLFVDGTFGRGGHSAAILGGLNADGRLHAFDHDPEAEAEALRRFAAEPRLCFHAANFSEMADIARAEGWHGCVDGLLLDLGVSSPQLDDAARGFSFSHDGPLDMRMNPRAGVSAAEWLAGVDVETLADVLYQYGDERNSRRIAQRIVESRVTTPLTRTAQLAELIASVPGPRSKTIHPATRSFQAIRIAINRELEVLREVLDCAIDLLAPGGRLAVISFHSLEDRIVKQFLREHAGRREARNKYAHLAGDGRGAETASGVALTEIGRVFPSEGEIATNVRARSAVLRLAEKRA